MTVDELQVLITANTKQLQSEIAKTNKTISGLSKTANNSSKSLSSSFLKANVFTKLLSVGVSAISKNLDGAISRLDTLNNFPKVMSNLGISTQDADASIQRLSDKLTGLPTTLDDAVSSVQRLTATNGNVKASTDMFLALNNAILSGGASTEIQKSALEQLSQAYAKGKPDMMEWRTALTAMPAQLKQIATAMGYVDSNALGEALRNGTVSMNDFMNTITKLNKEGINGFQSFEEQALNSTGGVATSITNVKTAITRGLTEIMNAIGQSNIAGFFQGIARAINKVTPYITGFVKACVWAVQSISAIFGGKASSTTKKVVDSVSNSMSSLGTSTSSTADDIDDATGSAKKLNKELKQLAGFDEMNVLTEPTDSGDSGSGSSGAGGLGDLGDLDFSDWTTGLDSVSNKADEIAQKIQSVFSKVGEVISTVWNSEPVQAYVNLLSTQFGFIKDLAIQLGGDLWTNITGTWNNISDNVSIILTNLSTFFTQFWTDISDGIDVWGQPLIDGFSRIFNSIWKDVIDPIIQQISKIWADFSEILVKLWDEHGASLVQNIGEALKKAQDLFQKLWDNVINPIIKPFLEMFSNLWNDHLKDTVEKIGNFIMKAVDFAMKLYNNFIQPILMWLIDKLSPAFTTIGSIISNVFGTVFGVISDVIGGIVDVFSGLIDFIEGIFTGNWEQCWNGIVSIFDGIFSAISSIAKFPINLLIDLLNGFISGINAIKIPDWVPAVGGRGIDIPYIPKLAKGGIVDNPTVAMIGEAGKEAIVPLEHNTQGLDKLAEILGDKIGGNDQPIQLVVQLGEDTIFDKFIDYTKSKSFETNGEVFSL